MLSVVITSKSDKFDASMTSKHLCHLFWFGLGFLLCFVLVFFKGQQVSGVVPSPGYSFQVEFNTLIWSSYYVLL